MNAGLLRDPEGGPGSNLAGRLLPVLLALLLVAGAACSGKSGPKQETIAKSRAQALYRLGLRYYQDGNVRGAYGELSKAIDLEPKNPTYLSALGLVAFELDQHEQAEDLLQRAIKLDPALTEAYMQLGVVYSEMGEYDVAEQYYERALKDPAYMTPEKVYVNWGVTRLKLGDTVGAEVKFRQAIDVNPRYPRAHWELGRLMENEGDLEGALQEYQEAWKGMPEVPDLNLKLGEIYFALGDATQARVYFEKVIAVAPGSTQAGEARDYLERMPSR